MSTETEAKPYIPDWPTLANAAQSGALSQDEMEAAIGVLRAGNDPRPAIKALEPLVEAEGGAEARFLLAEALHHARQFKAAAACLKGGVVETQTRTRMNELGLRFLPRVQERRRLYGCDSFFELQGKRVLEVGGMLPREFVYALRPEAWTCLDLQAEEQNYDWYRIVTGDAADMPLPSEDYDVVFSSSAFEHIGNLPRALEEMQRVLRPAGIVYSDFSPIWSSAQGHHLRGIARDVLREASAWPLPDWLHLTLTKKEMREYLAECLAADKIHHVERWLYRRPTLNRMFYEDYIADYYASGMSVLRIDLRRASPPDAKTLKLLRTKRPGRSNFEVNGMRVVLQKEKRKSGSTRLKPASPQDDAAVRGAVDSLLGEPVQETLRIPGHSDRQAYMVRLKNREVILKVLNIRKPRAIGCEFVVSALNFVDVPTPRVLASSKADGFFDSPYLIQEKAAGTPMDTWISGAKPGHHNIVSVIHELGQLLRRVHSVRAPDGFGPINDEGKGRYKTWMGYLENSIVRQKSGRRVRILDLKHLRKNKHLKAEEVDKIQGLFAQHKPLLSIDKPFVLHNDLTLKNVFVDPKTLQITALIDLHNALAGDPAMELARFYYFYRGRGYYEHLLNGYGIASADFGLRQRLYLVYILIEKLEWLKGREKRFPDRLHKDLATLRDTLDQV